MICGQTDHSVESDEICSQKQSELIVNNYVKRATTMQLSGNGATDNQH